MNNFNYITEIETFFLGVVMSLSDGAFGPAAQGDMFATDALNSFDEFGGALDVDMGVDFSDAFMDVLVDRTQPSVSKPIIQDAGSQDVAQAQKPNDPIQDAVSAMQNARSMAQETTKLEAGKMTAASGQGAKAAGDFAQAKGAAVQDAKQAMAAVQKEMKGATASAPSAPSGGGGRGMVANAAATSVVAAAAKMVFPAAGAAIDMAGAGSFITANAPTRGAFKSAAADAMRGSYAASEGHQTIDVMSGTTTTAPTTMGNAMNRSMAEGPGFGKISMEEIRYSTEASLEDMKPGMFSEEGMNAIMAELDTMQEDADLGAAMYQRWRETGISIEEAASEMPIAALDLDEAQQAALVMDNPNLQQDTFSPFRLG